MLFRSNKRFLILSGLLIIILAISVIALYQLLLRLPASSMDDNYTTQDQEVLSSPAHLYGTSKPAGKILARLQDKVITKPELSYQFQILPEEMRGPFTRKEDTLNFLRQYIGLELVYQAGIKSGLGRDSTIIARTQEAKKQFIMERYLDQYLGKNDFVPSETEIEEYYQANRSHLGNQSLNQAREQVKFLLSQEHRRAAYQDLVSRLWQESSVELYEDSL